MIRLIRYEFIKQFCKRSIFALFVAFSLANLFKIYGEYKSYSYLADGSGERSWHTVYWQLYKEYQGEITPEKIERLLAVYQPLLEATSDMTASTATDDPNTMTGNLYSDRNLLDKGVIYNNNFNILLVMTILVTCFMVLVISSNVVLSLGMVGALSIVRYRTAVKDPLDVGFLFWTVAVGVTCGAGLYLISVLGTVFTAAVYILLVKIRNHKLVWRHLQAVQVRH